MTEEERVARMGIRERIQYELSRIAKQEEATRVRIARENKKRELVMQIKEEMAKIRGLEVGTVVGSPTTQVEEEDLPGWVKMVQSAELKRAAASGLGKSSHPEQEIQNGEKVPSSSYNDKPKQEESTEGNVTEKTTADSKPAMTFEESVSALLDLIEEEKRPRSKPTLMSKKTKDVKVSCNLKVVSEAKHKFEELSNSASPTSPGWQQNQQPVLDHEINRLNVQKAKESLLKTQQESVEERATTTRAEGSKGIFRKKCSDIKEMLTKKTQKKDQKQLQGARKQTKKVIWCVRFRNVHRIRMTFQYIPRLGDPSDSGAEHRGSAQCQEGEE